MSGSQNSLPWKILLAVILLVLAAGVWGAVQKIDYQWRWYRVPQYFLYLSEDVHKIPFDGNVKSIVSSAGKSEVTVISDTSEQETFVVDTESLKVSEGESLFEGDTIGFTEEWRLGPLMYGLWTTMWISAVSSFFALFLGLIAGLARISKNITLRGLSVVYIECIRGTPLLVQIFLAYFFLGTVFNLSRNVCGIGALALFAGAAEASRSLGMSAFQTMREVILPQAFKKILPPLSGQFISLIKDSSLISVIAITELTKSGREIVSSTFATFEVWLVVAAMYLLITSVLSQIVYYLERRFAISD